MRPGLKLILITLPLALIGVAILAYVISTRTPPDRHELSERASPVRVVTAETYQVAPALVGFGVVAPARTYQAIAEVGGTVDFVNPLLRDGQIRLAGRTVEPRELEQRLRQQVERDGGNLEVRIRGDRGVAGEQQQGARRLPQLARLWRDHRTRRFLGTACGRPQQ